jgi:hypothetical protein
VNVRRQLAFALATVLLLWVALFNGYPTVWWDSGDYLQSSFLLTPSESRPIFYGLFLRYTHWQRTLWTTVAVQSALIVYVIRATVEAATRIRSRWRDLVLVGVIALLAVGTALPWVVGLIMADIFAGICVLALFLVLLHSRFLSRANLAAYGLFVLSIVVHLSLLPLAIVLTIVAQAYSFWCVPLSRTALRAAWSAVILAIIVSVTTNRHLIGRAVVSPTTHVFLLGRLLAEGIPQQVLAEHCGTRHYALCPYLGDLPAERDHYLWNPNSPLQRIGGWQGSSAESWRIIRDSVVEHPWLVATIGARSFVKQLVDFQTFSDSTRFVQGTGINYAMATYLPAEYPKYLQARQQQGRLREVAFRDFHWWVFVCSALASIVIGTLAWRKRMMELALLHTLVGTAVIANAAIVAVLAQVDDRYQERIVWLVPFSVLVSLVSYLAADRGHLTGVRRLKDERFFLASAVQSGDHFEPGAGAAKH